MTFLPTFFNVWNLFLQTIGNIWAWLLTWADGVVIGLIVLYIVVNTIENLKAVDGTAGKDSKKEK